MTQGNSIEENVLSLRKVTDLVITVSLPHAYPSPSIDPGSWLLSFPLLHENERWVSGVKKRHQDLPTTSCLLGCWVWTLKATKLLKLWARNPGLNSPKFWSWKARNRTQEHKLLLVQLQAAVLGLLPGKELTSDPFLPHPPPLTAPHRHMYTCSCQVTLRSWHSIEALGSSGKGAVWQPPLGPEGEDAILTRATEVVLWGPLLQIKELKLREAHFTPWQDWPRTESMIPDFGMLSTRHFVPKGCGMGGGGKGKRMGVIKSPP